ncbi:MAG TPA: GNAT family N-acetyltransferase [Pyrinomonadaceae bacterium]|jgi:ribosomal protein S18 acetylase RimI-like enzyme|nr:GNAT family N-acetyltransferase [Pyrinomonadaceae bacterium]
MTQQFIRRASEADCTLLAELGAKTFYDSFAAQNAPENMAAYLAKTFGPEQQRAELTDPQNTFLIAENDGVAIGYAQLRTGEPPVCVSGPKAIELVRLYVSATLQSAGIGGKLMDACLKEARQRGYQTIWLGVWQQNTRAQAFYKRWDFSIVGEHVFQLGGDPQLDWIMQRSLTTDETN